MLSVELVLLLIKCPFRRFLKERSISGIFRTVIILHFVATRQFRLNEAANCTLRNVAMVELNPKTFVILQEVTIGIFHFLEYTCYSMLHRRRQLQYRVIVKLSIEVYGH